MPTTPLTPYQQRLQSELVELAREHARSAPAGAPAARTRRWSPVLRPAALAAAGVLAVAIAVLPSVGPGDAAYAVERFDDGRVGVRILDSFDDYRDPESLEQRVRRMGVDLDVEVRYYRAVGCPGEPSLEGAVMMIGASAGLTPDGDRGFILTPQRGPVTVTLWKGRASGPVDREVKVVCAAPGAVGPQLPGASGSPAPDPSGSALPDPSGSPVPGPAAS